MKNEAYIKGGKCGIDIYYLFSLFDYDGTPIVFVGQDDKGDIYLCDCTEFRFGKQHWVIASTTINLIESVIKGKATVYSAIEASDKVILAVYDIMNDEFCQRTSCFDQISPEYLPDCDSFISCDDEDISEHVIRLKKQMRDFSPSELVQYCDSIRKLFKPTGLNVFDL